MQRVAELAVERLGLHKLPAHLPTFFVSFVFFLSIHQVFGPVLSIWVFPNTYGKMTRRGKNNWNMHIVSQVHALIIIPLAWNAIHIESLEKDRAFGWDDYNGFVQAIACGYFLWDTLDAIINFIDIGFVMHGLACLLIYMLSFKPFLAYYASRCLLWEASTVFLNNQWFLDKTDHTGSLIQLVNGLVLLVVFLGIRIIYGGITSYDFFRTLYAAKGEIPVAYIVVYGGGNLVLQGLNWIWYRKMIDAVRRRFSSKEKKM